MSYRQRFYRKVIKKPTFFFAIVKGCSPLRIWIENTALSAFTKYIRGNYHWIGSLLFKRILLHIYARVQEWTQETSIDSSVHSWFRNEIEEGAGKKQRKMSLQRPILMEVTRRPQALRIRPILLAVTPLPSPLTTPPVTNTYFISASPFSYFKRRKKDH